MPYTYQWRRGNAVGDPSSYVDIAGATSQSYLAQAADVTAGSVRCRANDGQSIVDGAPFFAQAANTAFKLRPFADDSPFNIPIPPNSKAPYSDAQMATLRNGLINGFYVNASVWTPPLWTYYTGKTGGWTIDTIGGWDGYAHLHNVPVKRSGVFTSPGSPSTGEYQVIVIDKSADPNPNSVSLCDPTLWWVYSFEALQWNGSSWNCYGMGKFRYKGSGCWAVPDPTGRAVSSGKSGDWSYLAGLITENEANNGIYHALSVTLPNAAQRGPANTYDPNICSEPAQSSDGHQGTNPAYPKSGAHYQLDPAFDVNAYTSDTQLRNVLKALQIYGMFDGDSGGAPGFDLGCAHTAGETDWMDETTPAYSSALTTNGWGADLLPHIWIVNPPAPGTVDYDYASRVGGWTFP